MMSFFKALDDLGRGDQVTVPDQDLRGFLKNRIPSRDKIERIRAAGIVADDEFVQAFADSLLEIRQAVRGGTLNPPANHWIDV
jgi:hypothetical protein